MAVLIYFNTNTETFQDRKSLSMAWNNISFLLCNFTLYSSFITVFHIFSFTKLC